MFTGLKRRAGRLASLTALAAFICGTAQAAPIDAEMDLLAAAFSGETSHMQTLTETEMQESRGGYRGFAFGLFISGDISSLPADGSIPDNIDVVEQTPDNVSLNVGLAGLPNSGGLIQFASIVGDNNIINNNMTLNVYILEGGVADTSSFTDASAFFAGG